MIMKILIILLLALTIFQYIICFNLNYNKHRIYIKLHNYMSINRGSNDQVPRLHADLDGLLKWSEKSGAKIDVKVKKDIEGWSLYANNDTLKEIDLLSIPKKLCLYADPSKSKVSLLENAINLINTLDKQQWRARLAIALLSERVRPNSPYRFYVRNLPFEFWGMPIFFSTAEFNIMQDLSLMIRTRYRCRFLTDFSDNVLGPLHNKVSDPFSGHVADVNAFGWGFATAASRALRNPDVIGEDGHVMVPLIDIASHSFDPNCIIVNTESSFLLRTIKDIKEGEELTIDYGPLSNEELLEDYGFTVDDNQYDKILVKCDHFLLNTARIAMGQANINDDYTHDIVNMKDKIVNIKIDNNAEEINSKFSAIALESNQLKIGHGGNKIIDRWLNNWQVYWLKSLKLYGNDADYAMTISGSNIEGIDGRLWAFLRILYSRDEEELLQHGYNPFILKQPGAIVSIKNEAQVLKTMTGLIAVMLRLYGSDLDSDIQKLKSEIVNESSLSTSNTKDDNLLINSDDIITDVHKILRSIFHLKAPLPMSPTARKLLIEKDNNDDSYTSSLSIPSSDIPKSKRNSVEDLIIKEVSKQKEKQKLKDQKKIQLESFSIHNYDENDEIENSNENIVILDDTINNDENCDNDNNDDNDISNVNINIINININDIGLGLPINVREGLRYRIRKKKAMYKLCYELKQKYDNLKRLDLGINDDLLSSIPVFETKDDESINQNKRIRDLLDEMNPKNNIKEVDDVLNEAKNLALQWSSKGLNL